MEEIALFVVPVLITIFVFALIKGWMDARAQARSEKVKLLEEALKNPAIDRATIENLTYQLTGTKKRSGPSALMATVLAIGWLALFCGIGMWVLGEMVREKDILASGIICAIVGFGFVTYPFALRELEARRAQQ
ncbi:MAG: hypothetical protein KAI24_20525 [Planctomycetes bacterium]|nr:hypothetical protein [Planctomycetota bacterium]